MPACVPNRSYISIIEQFVRPAQTVDAAITVALSISRNTCFSANNDMRDLSERSNEAEALKKNCENRNGAGRSALAVNKIHYAMRVAIYHYMPDKYPALYPSNYFTTFGAAGTGTACGLANSEASSFGFTTTFSITIFSVG